MTSTTKRGKKKKKMHIESAKINFWEFVLMTKKLLFSTYVVSCFLSPSDYIFRTAGQTVKYRHRHTHTHKSAPSLIQYNGHIHVKTNLIGLNWLGNASVAQKDWF